MADERLTNFYVDYNIEDTTAKNDATFVTEDSQQYFTNLQRLRYTNKNLKLDRFTFEHNFNILDGSRTEMENNSDNELSFVNMTYVDNSIIFEESTDSSVEVNSSSNVEHLQATYTKQVELDAGTYYLTGCPSGGSNTSYKLSVDITGIVDYGQGATFTLDQTTTVTMTITVAKDYFAEGLVFYPVISKTEPTYVRAIVPYFNDELSDMNGEYENNPKVVINFTREHASIAFVMRFLDDHPLEARLTFYDLDGEMITTFLQPIVSNEVLVEHDISGYAKIEIEFTKTAPGRYIKFTSFIFGIVITWDETNVRNASLIQQTDRLSKNIAIDTLSFTVIDVTSDLNLGNPEGMHRYFQKNQYMLPYETINGRKIALGKYYLKTFSENTNLGKMSAQSYLGIMDDNTFYDGEVYNGKRAGEVIEDIFYTMGLNDYTIDAQTYEQPLYGTITPKSCRKALNEVLFACNSVINAHDMENIIIKKTSQVQRPDIPRDSKFSTTASKNDYTFGVEVKYTSYVKDVDRKEIAKGTYEAGSQTIYFTQPYTDLILNDGSEELNLVENTAETTEKNGVTFTVNEDGSVTLNGTASAGSGLTVMNITLPAGTYVVSDNNNAPTESYYGVVYVYDTTTSTTIARSSYRNQQEFTLAESKSVRISIWAPANATFTDYKVIPLLRNKSDIRAVLTEVKPYYAKFDVIGQPDISITGIGYTTVTNSQKATQSKLKPGEEEKIVSYNTNLCNTATAKELANKILTYLNYDLTVKIKWLADGNDMGDLHIVENPVEDFNDYYGVFTKRSFDLTGGFIDTAEMAATAFKEHLYKYMRDPNPELHAGEEGLI